MSSVISQQNTKSKHIYLLHFYMQTMSGKERELKETILFITASKYQIYYSKIMKSGKNLYPVLER